MVLQLGSSVKRSIAMAHFKSASITATYFEVKYSTCVCSPVRITLCINAVDLFTHFQHCSFHLSL